MLKKYLTCMPQMSDNSGKKSIMIVNHATGINVKKKILGVFLVLKLNLASAILFDFRKTTETTSIDPD